MGFIPRSTSGCVNERIRAKDFPREPMWFAAPQTRNASSAISPSRPGVEERNSLPSAKLRRGLPERVPLLLIGRLAVDAQWRGRGVGSALLADALNRCLAASEIAGVRCVVAHAIDEGAVGFYERLGFIRCPLGECAMLMPIETVRSLIARE